MTRTGRAKVCLAAAALATVFGVAPAFAAPSDCSKAPIPDKPVGGVVNGKPFVAQQTEVSITRDGMSMNDDKFDSYRLTIMTDGIFNALSVNMLVRAGTKPDGKAWRVLPVDSIGGQPAATQGLPEVQGWDLELEAADVNTSFTQDIASIRVEWGTRQGDTLPGKIYFCVPSAKAEIMGAFSATLR